MREKRENTGSKNKGKYKGRRKGRESREKEDERKKGVWGGKTKE